MVPSGTPGRPDAICDLTRATLGAAFEELEPIGIEEDAVALGQPHRARVGAVVNHAEEDEELRPGAVALVHRVREERGVFTQALIETCERVVTEVGLVLRKHVALLCVEEKDESQDDGEECAVDLVGVICERVA